MPEYLSPGVYVEEIKIGSKPIEGVSTSTAGFLGEAERGPTTPRLVASWLQFQRVFGSFFGANKYLPYAVQGFFDNGGRRCYIGRIVKAGAAPATMATLKLTAGGADALTVDATGEGEWGNKIALTVSAGTISGFKLKVFYWKAAPSTLYDPDTDLTSQPRPQVTEFFDNLSVSESSPDYFEKRVNGISNLIELSVAGADSAAQPDGPAAITSLAGGGDGTGDLSSQITRGQIRTRLATGKV